MRKLFFKLTLLLLPFFVLISSVNFYVDPARLFHAGYEAKMSEIMLSGKNVKGISNYNDRILQIEYIKRQRIIPDTVVIGGSKAMMISNKTLESIFGPGKCFNHGMSQATLYDYTGVIDCYKRRGQLPENILFSVDPHILSPVYKNEMYKPFEEYNNNKRIYFFQKNSMELFSFSYFQSSLISYLSGERATNPEATTKASDLTMAIKLADGRRSYSRRVLAVKKEQSNAMALKSAKNIVMSSSNIRELDQIKIEKFKEMIAFLKNNGVNIAFYLPPYHPLVYKNIEGSDVREIADKSEKWFIDFGAAHGIKVYGSYNPNFTGCKEADYFDGGHLRSENIAKTFLRR